MKLNEVREKYINFMKERGHTEIPSAPIIPKEDSTTLFTSSGMQALVPYLMGEKHPGGNKLTNSQRCLRANDIDEVGDNRHTTFFEMLGNWSFGDYFKEKQIEQCFLFLVDKEKGLGLNPSKLYVTVFGGDEKNNIPQDEESAKIWEKMFSSVGIETSFGEIITMENGDKKGMKGKERIFFYDSEKNWWSRSGSPENMIEGDIGGPDTEVFYDFGEEYNNNLAPHPNTNSGRFVEICNSVFIEYVKKNGEFISLEQKNVDFGGGLERLVSAAINEPDVFLIDIFDEIREKLDSNSTLNYKNNPEPFRIVLDHMRSSMFIISEGVNPSNTDSGYVLRRLIRTALYNLKYVLKVNSISLFSVVESYIDNYKYTDKDKIRCVIEEEEKRFIKTLEKGRNAFEEMIKDKKFDGKDLFVLQSTYGFPKELGIKLAKENGIEVDLEIYEKEMNFHREESKKAVNKQFRGGLVDMTKNSIKYHTTTHLLNQALIDVLGDNVSQKGSNITPQRLRFDFSFNRKLTDEEKEEVQKIVNNKISEKLSVTYSDMSTEEAKKLGAIGVFDYGDIVRVYSVGNYSKEFCGGPHVKNTGELGKFKIISEKGISSGVRRIKAILE